MEKSGNTPLDIARAKELRRTGSLCERLLWNALRENKKASALKFRRQHPLHPYVVDFICLSSRLIVELDGPSHDTRQAYDKTRTVFLEKQGYRVLRFANDVVRANLSGVVETILQEASKP